MSVKPNSILRLSRTSNITRVVRLNSSVELSVINDLHNSLVMDLEKMFPKMDDTDVASATLNTLVSAENSDDDSTELKQKIIYVVTKEHWNNYQEDVISDLRTMTLESIDHIVYVAGSVALYKELSSVLDNKLNSDLNNYLSEYK